MWFLIAIYHLQESDSKELNIQIGKFAELTPDLAYD